MSRRTLVFCVFAVAAAVVFVRFGLWQLDRLGERRSFNETIVRQQRDRAAPFAEVAGDTARAQYRAVYLEGRFDYTHELVLSNRIRRGSPGVEVITPLRLAGSDTAVLVNRGWVYASDGAYFDHVKWRERDSAAVVGFVKNYAPDAGITSSTSSPWIVRRVSRAEVASKIPYPVAPVYMVAAGDTVDLRHPARQELPRLDDGPHLGYALQWFSFALIALGGAGLVVVRDRRSVQSHAVRMNAPV